jgi:hypothetical protein
VFFLEQETEIPIHINHVKLYFCVFQLAIFCLYCLLSFLTVNVIKKNEDSKTTKNSLPNAAYSELFSLTIKLGGGPNCRPLKVLAQICMPRYTKEQEII